MLVNYGYIKAVVDTPVRLVDITSYLIDDLHSLYYQMGLRHVDILFKINTFMKW